MLVKERKRAGQLGLFVDHLENNHMKLHYVLLSGVHKNKCNKRTANKEISVPNSLLATIIGSVAVQFWHMQVLHSLYNVPNEFHQSCESELKEKSCGL